MKVDQRIMLILSILLIGGIVAFFWWREHDCNQKKCPDGLKPYMGAHSSKCLCVREAE